MFKSPNPWIVLLFIIWFVISIYVYIISYNVVNIYVWLVFAIYQVLTMIYCVVVYNFIKAERYINTSKYIVMNVISLCYGVFSYSMYLFRGLVIGELLTREAFIVLNINICLVVSVFYIALTLFIKNNEHVIHAGELKKEMIYMV